MKQGTGDDPFAETSEDGTAVNSGGEHVDHTASDESVGPIPTDSANDPDPDGKSPAEMQAPSDLPYLARRRLTGKSIKADREHVPFFLRSDTRADERDLRRTVEEELGKEVHKTNLREAAYVFAQRNPKGVADILREWGIEFLQ